MALFRGLGKKSKAQLAYIVGGVQDIMNAILQYTPHFKRALACVLLTIITVQFPSFLSVVTFWNAAPSVLKITKADSIESGGTGFFVETAEGVKILTNAHICRALDNKMGLGFQEGDYEPTLLYVEKISERFDLCLMSGIYKKSGLKLADSISERQSVSVLGHPMLQPLSMARGEVIHNIITRIPISSDRTEICEGDGLYRSEGLCVHFENSWLLSVQIYPGNSGSPVLNIWGNVVGIVFAADGMTNKGRIVGIYEIKEFLQQNHLLSR